ncbi:MAG: nucleoside triphosphate pyrophosphohydrolase [Pseudomonadota bacterium]
MEPARDISRLIEIMARLRDPENGCAWDVEQTFSTIAPYTIEEAYEVADAIERDDMPELTDELGDLLLQVVFHARMAQEENAFDFGDVVNAITTKMIRRHPHVFGEENQRSRKLAKGTWDKIKAQEKAEKRARQLQQSIDRGTDEAASLLDDVPRALPALIRALKLQQKAATVGFDWDTAPPILDKIEEEIGELRSDMQAGNSAGIEEEYGDLLFAVVNLGRHLDVNPEGALTKASNKFKSRFAYIEKRLTEDGKEPAAATLAEMEALWIEAKSGPKTP